MFSWCATFIDLLPNLQFLTELKISQHYKRISRQNFDSISIRFGTPDFTCEKWKVKVAVGWEGNTSMFTEWKVSKYGVFSGPHFPAFSLNTGKYGPEKTPHLDTFDVMVVRGMLIWGGIDWSRSG